MNNISKHIFVFFGLVVLQTLVLNQINLFGLVNPYVFPIFILLLPFNTTRSSLLLIAFCFGFLIDLFNGTLGMHAFACTTMAFFRSIFINSFDTKKGKFDFPSLDNHGFVWMLSYFSSMLFIHHLFYFFIESGSFSHTMHTILLSIFSLFFSVFVSFLLLFLFKRSKK